MDNDTSVQPQPFIIEGTRNGGSPVRTTGRLDSYGVGKLPAAWWFPAPRGVEFQCPHGLELLLNLLLQFRLIFLFQFFAGVWHVMLHSFNALSGLSCYWAWSIADGSNRCFNALTGLSCYSEHAIFVEMGTGFNALSGLSCYSTEWENVLRVRSFNALSGLSCYGKNAQYFKFFMILFIHTCYL